MKKNAPLTYCSIHLFVILMIIILFLSSCEEGLFNFNEETGNVSISFSAKSVSDSLDKLIVVLSNDDTGAEIEKEESIEDDGSTQSADIYFSRIDVGNWNMYIKVLNADGEVVSEREEFFELSLGETIISKLEYYSGGTLDVFYEESVGSQPESLIWVDAFDTLISILHYYPETIDNINIGTVLIAEGGGFDTYLSGIRAEFPDSSYFEYDGGSSRSVSGIEVEVQSDYLSVSRSGYFSSGDYSLSLTDVNSTETTETDNCSLDFSADTGFISFNDVTPYEVGDITTAMYEFNDAQPGDSVITYIVSQSDGYAVSALNIFNPGDIDQESEVLLVDYTGAAGFGESWVVIATLDLDYTTASDLTNGIHYHFTNESPNMSPESLPGWLYLKYGDQLNYVGISVQSFYFS